MQAKKKCTSCQKTKFLKSFHKNKSNKKDGHTYECKVCIKKKRKQKQRQKEKEIAKKERKLDLEYEKILEGKVEQQNFFEKTFHKRNEKNQPSPIKFKKDIARYKLQYAVARKKIIKPKTCPACGKTDCIIDGHHIDYTSPLEVLWLCRSCHIDLHKMYNEINKIY